MAVEKVKTLQQFKVFVNSKDYAKVSLKRVGSFTPEIEGIYPFRVRFKDLGYPGISSGNAPAIGLAVIGSSFYIL
jgi:hypothetical protein